MDNAGGAKLEGVADNWQDKTWRHYCQLEPAQRVELVTHIAPAGQPLENSNKQLCWHGLHTIIPTYWIILIRAHGLSRFLVENKMLKVKEKV